MIGWEAFRNQGTWPLDANSNQDQYWNQRHFSRLILCVCGLKLTFTMCNSVVSFIILMGQLRKWRVEKLYMCETTKYLSGRCMGSGLLLRVYVKYINTHLPAFKSYFQIHFDAIFGVCWSPYTGQLQLRNKPLEMYMGRTSKNRKT